MSRQRVVVAPFGTHRVVCSDGTVWAELGADSPRGVVRSDGLKEWVQVMAPIPDAPPAPAPRRKKP